METKVDEQSAAIIADRMKRAKDQDYWHACLVAALDAGKSVEEAMDIADKLQGQA